MVVHGVVRHNEAFADASWSLNSDLLKRLNAVATALTPSDPVRTSVWLFTERLPDIEGLDKMNSWDLVEQARRKAVEAVFKGQGTSGVVRLAEAVEGPRYVAFAFGEITEGTTDAFDAINLAFAGSPRLASFAEWVSAVAHRRFGPDWDAIVRGAVDSARWNLDQFISAVVAWPHVKATWEFVESFGDEAKLKYWRARTAWGIEASGDDLEYAITSYIAAERPEMIVDWLSSRAGDIATSTILTVLDAFYDRLSRAPNLINASIVWDLQQFFAVLDGRDDVDLSDLARREYAYLPLLRETGPHKRSTLALDHLMAKDPSFFVEVICDVYRAANVNPDELPAPTDLERNKATWGWHLLEGFREVPGLNGQNLDKEQLRSWVGGVRRLAKEAGRSAVAEQKIGILLANVPNDPRDNTWPHRVLRELVEGWKAPEIERGIMLGRVNMRGVTTRGMYEGGAQERELAKSIRSSADKLIQWPRTQALVLNIAEIYEQQAQQEDTVAEQEKLRDR